MKTLIKIFSTALLFSLFRTAGAVEGIEPPRKPVKVDIQIDEDRHTAPAQIINKFTDFYSEPPLQKPNSAYFLSLLPSTKNISGNINILYNNSKAAIWGLYSLYGEKYSKLISEFSSKVKLADKIFTYSKLNIDYSRTELKDLSPQVSYLYPIFTTINGDIQGYYTWSKGFLSLSTQLDGFYVSKYPRIEPKKVSLQPYKEFAITAGLKIYQYILPTLGAFSVGNYYLMRNGFFFSPKNARFLKGGFFYEYAPFIIKIGVSYAYSTANFDKSIAPLAEFKLYSSPLSLKISYSANIQPHILGETVFDRLSTYYPSYSPTVNHLVNITGTVNYKWITLSGQGSYGKSKSIIYYTYDSNSKFTTIHIDSGTVMTFDLRSSIEKKIATTNIQNISRIIYNNSRLQDNFPVPNTMKYIIIDTLTISPADNFSLSSSVEYHSGYYSHRDWRTFNPSRFAALAFEISYKWRNYRFSIYTRLINSPLFYTEYKSIENTSSTGVGVIVSGNIK